MSDEVQEAVHPEPVWRDRGNFIIASEINPGGTSVTTEQLWVRKLGDRWFEICCIPFLVYDLALGDVVETDAEYMVRSVVRPSGHYTFRVSFGQSFHPRDEIAKRVVELGAVIEWSSQNLLAVDAVDGDHAQKVADFLQQAEEQGQLIYETGRRVAPGAAATLA